MSYRMVRAGVGEYDQIPNFSWLYNPPPYDFLDKPGTSALSNFYAPASMMRLANDRSGRSGLGCPGCGGKCGCGAEVGLGQATSWTTVNWGLTSTDIGTMFGLGTTVQNWIFYAGVIAAIALVRGMRK